jgi:hypothetical protein
MKLVFFFADNKPSTVYRLPPTVYRLPSTVYRLPPLSVFLKGLLLVTLLVFGGAGRCRI